MKTIILCCSILCYCAINAQQFQLEEFATGFNDPVEIVNAKDNRLFVVQQDGIIKIVQPNGTNNSTNFLNISSKISYSGEMGLLGLAFHPQYATNGKFYIFYNNSSGSLTVAKYLVSLTNPDVADVLSEQVLLTIPKPFANHNGGKIAFGPDHFLWIATGDGGSGGDPNNNAQNKNSLLGKILRIDVDTANPYAIPANNPFVGIDGADEIWSYGIRNAWKFVFDDEKIWIADVGQGNFEEINIMPTNQGGINYGWRCYEGNNTYNNSGCANASTMTFPVAVYNHSNGRCSITGGYVYRGSLYEDIKGKYIFTDYCTPQIGVLNDDGSIVWSNTFSGNNFSTFGEDVHKELYVAAINNGKIYKVKTSNLAINESVKNQFSIYPNPAISIININGLQKNQNNSIEIYAADGRKVFEKENIIDKRIDISELKSGIYFLTIFENGQKKFSQKIIKR